MSNMAQNIRITDVILGIIIGIFTSWIATNLLPSLPDITGWYVNILALFANWRAKRSIQAAQKRIQKLEAQLENDKVRIQNTASFVAYVGRDIIRVSMVIVYYMGALILLVWIWFVAAYEAVTKFLATTKNFEPQNIFLSIRHILAYDISGLSHIVVISLFVFYSFLLLNCHYALRRLLKFSSFEQYEKNIQNQIEDLRNFIESQNKSG